MEANMSSPYLPFAARKGEEEEEEEGLSTEAQGGWGGSPHAFWGSEQVAQPQLHSCRWVEQRETDFKMVVDRQSNTRGTGNKPSNSTTDDKAESESPVCKS